MGELAGYVLLSPLTTPEEGFFYRYFLHQILQPKTNTYYVYLFSKHTNFS